ncbi:cell division cycle protein 20 homolog [Ruditapes philippinarum]|uniref:cell division cycle protein 20 homolog n=1 Tax=Ruditapes philippinarum TaxID=129788 RepID=UPI00295C260D|nr:cell division cycle protein 20 homolog [Ruditapes philippinarum]
MSHFTFDNMIADLTKLDGSLQSGPPQRWRKKASSGLEPGGLSPRLSNRTPGLTPNLPDSAKSVKTPGTGKASSKTEAALGVPPNKGRWKTPSKTPNKGGQQDRFIPNRVTSDMDMAGFAITCGEDEENISPSKVEYRKQLGEAMNIPENTRILSYQKNQPKPAEGHANNLQVIYSKKPYEGPGQGSSRVIPSVPERILDAPELLDDYYLNLLDWSSNNHLSVALGSSVFIWNASSGIIVQLMTMDEPGQYISAVKWIEEGSIIGVGTSQGHVELWDVAVQKRIRSMTGHVARVGSLSWNSHILSSGSRSGVIHHSDVRVADHCVGVLNSHTQDVCGLCWSPDGKFLASGGNDNILNIWNNHLGNDVAPLLSLTHHQAAVKALSWCPWQPNILASGGGTADRHIRIWNVNTGSNLSSVDAKSQVCAILWSKEYKELISGHGFSQNQLSIWKYPDLTKVTDLEGHKARVLNLAMSPDNTMVASAAADETIRIWNCFASDKTKKSISSKPGIQKTEHVLLKASHIR